MPETWRAYSIVSADYDDFLEFYSIVVPGGEFTSVLADLRVGDEILRAPVSDVYLPAGHHALAVRETGGAWRTLEIDVVADRPTRVDVKLDTLPPAIRSP